MRRPGLTPNLFCDDAVLSRRSLFRPGEPLVFSGNHPLIAPLAQSSAFPEGMDALILEIENLTENPLCVGLRLGTEGDPPRVFSSGGREVLEPGIPAQVLFPFESFGFHGPKEPEIRKIELLVRRERDRERPVRLEVAVTSLTGLMRSRPAGPRLTEAGLGTALDGDPEEALGPRDFSPHTPDNPLLRVPPPVFSYERDSGRKVLSGRIMGAEAGFPPDWSADPEGELEWRHFLHRHHFLRPLVRLLRRTGDPGYLRALERVLTDWIAKNPPPLASDGGAGPGWETLSVAFRVREWLWVLGAAWNLSGFDRRVRSLLLRSVWEHGRHLAEYRGHPGNWRLLEAASLSLLALYFPDFRASAEWLDLGLERLEREAALQFLPDGMHFEISPLYHGLCAQACLEVLEAAQPRGVGIPPVIRDGLPRWFRALAALYRPNFTRPSINDSGGFLDHERALLRCAGSALNLPDLLWAGSLGRRGRVPDEKNTFLPDAGLAVLRSADSGGGLCLLFRAGPPGAAHVHRDNLSLELSVRGRPVLVDPGISRYAPSPLTEAYRGAEAHSTILLTGSGPTARSPFFGERTALAGSRLSRTSLPGLEVVTGTRSGGTAVVTRSVAMVAERFVVVNDYIGGSGRVEARVHWQFAPGLKVVICGEDGRRVAVSDPDELVELVFMTPPAGCRVERKEGTTDPPAGFVAHRGRDLPAARLEYVFTVDLPAVLRWVFWPSFLSGGGRPDE